jgi:DNA-binding winged helix-turn-helix (wHTH) protein/tetratricopeptide (TPR) repeat protein
MPLFTNHFYQFGEFTLDNEQRVLLRGGAPLRLAPKVFDTLLILVRNGGRIVGKEELMRGVWPDTFVEESNLTFNIQQLRRSLGDDARRPRYVETVPRRGYRFIAEVRRGRSDSSSSDQNSDQIDSIAVMPFTNESVDPGLAYLSDGITEMLISSLSRLPDLRVKARSSVFRYKGKDASIRTISRELGAEAVLNGHLAQRGDDLTICLELIEGQTENVIWTERYKRRAGELPLLQSDIGRNVAQELRTRLTGSHVQRAAKNYTENAEALRLYLKGRFFLNKRTPIDARTAVEEFEQAIVLDGSYALALAGLAEAYIILANYGGERPQVVIPKAREAAVRALTLDESLPEVHVALGMIKALYDFDGAGSEQSYRRAIELNPNYANAHHQLGQTLGRAGRFAEAETHFQNALAIDPLSLIINRHYGEILLFAGKYDAAFDQLEKTARLDANFASVHASVGWYHWIMGNHAECVEELARELELWQRPDEAAFVRESFAKGGWDGFLRATATAREPILSPIHHSVAIYASLGDKQNAFAELERAYENRDYYFLLIKVDPRLELLRGDPRYSDLLRRAGLSQEL